MAKKKVQHVVKHNNGWAVKAAGAAKATKVHRLKTEAVKHAEQIARNQKSETKIHGLDGKIQGGNSYGNNPFPPRDKT